MMLALDYFRGEKDIKSLFGLAFIGLFTQHQPLYFLCLCNFRYSTTSYLFCCKFGITPSTS
jgi:hypothetical protein